VNPSSLQSRKRRAAARPNRGSKLARWLLCTAALVCVVALLVVPLLAVFVNAFSAGPATYFKSVSHPETVSAIKLTILTALVAVPLNAAFGVVAAWLIAKFDFPGKNLLVTLIDLPFSVSPVVSGLLFVLLFGRQGWFGPWLSEHDVRVIFAVPGIILATVFVTFPFVAREVLALLQTQDNNAEEAALTLGASGWQMFWHVTLPKAKWSIMYGTILCNARAMGEFGAVSVVSGHIRGMTNTMPLHVEILYNEYNFAGAFATASVLALLAVVTLVLKRVVEWRSAQ